MQKKNFIINSIFFEKLNNKLFIKGFKEKYLKIIYICWNFLKISKMKPRLLFFLILEKIKPIFFFQKKIKKIKKKKKIVYKPVLLSIKQRYIVSLKWFLLPLKKKQSLNNLLVDCFLIFLNSNKKNLALLQKKKTYLIILKYKYLIKF